MLTSEEIQLIRNEVQIAEKSGKPTKNQLNLIYKKRWFHLLVPKSMGGKEMPLPAFARFMEKLASVDGSFAWTVNLGAGANMFAGYMEEQTAKKIFASEKTCVAGSGAVGGTATKKDDGYIINGIWKYASGATHASFFSLNATIAGEENLVRSFLVPAAQVKILDTWNVTGLKATASCDFKVENQWVPENYGFNLQTPSSSIKSVLYRFPFNTLAEINMLVILTGLAIHFKELSIEIVKHKTFFGKNPGSNIKIYESNIFQAVLTEVDADFNAKREKTFTVLDRLWEKTEANKEVEEAEKDEFTKTVLQTANATRNLIDKLYPFLGMNVIFEDSEIGRVYRDFKVASQHVLLSPMRL